MINVKYAIQWAKSNIVNTMIFDQNEIIETITKLERNNLLFTSYEEALKISDIRVLYNNNTILYVIKVPISNGENFDTWKLKPVKKKNEIINLNFENIIMNNENIYGIKNKCKLISDLRICNKKDVINLNNDTCLTKILKGENSVCTISNGHHIPEAEELEPGLIILNSFIGTIKTNEAKQTLNGTFLIRFWNETIEINGRTFKNEEEVYTRVNSPILQTQPIERERIKILSLEALEELHIENTETIEKMNGNYKITTFSFITTNIILFICLCLFIIIRIRTNKKIIIENNSSKTDAENKQIAVIKLNNLSHY